jgi:hypothetical protein
MNEKSPPLLRKSVVFSGLAHKDTCLHSYHLPLFFIETNIDIPHEVAFPVWLTYSCKPVLQKAGQPYKNSVVQSGNGLAANNSLLF